MINQESKSIEYWKSNATEDYIGTPISVLRYISELEQMQVNKNGISKLLSAVLWLVGTFIASILIGYVLAYYDFLITNVTPAYIYGCLTFTFVKLIRTVYLHSR